MQKFRLPLSNSTKQQIYLFLYSTFWLSCIYILVMSLCMHIASTHILYIRPWRFRLKFSRFRQFGAIYNREQRLLTTFMISFPLRCIFPWSKWRWRAYLGNVCSRRNWCFPDSKRVLIQCQQIFICTYRLQFTLEKADFEFCEYSDSNTTQIFSINTWFMFQV